LAPGRLADCVAVDLDTLNCQPVFDPVSTLVYSAQGNQVSHVWVNGKLSLEQGRLVHMDERDLLPRARDWAGKIR